MGGEGAGVYKGGEAGTVHPLGDVVGDCVDRIAAAAKDRPQRWVVESGK